MLSSFFAFLLPSLSLSQNTSSNTTAVSVKYYPYSPRINASAPIYPPIVSTNNPVSPALAGRIPKTYSTLVVFGDSYSDNSHSRNNLFDSSYCVGPEYIDPNGGRCSNGLIAVDYMTQLNMTTPLSASEMQTLDFAFGAAFISDAFLLVPTSMVPAMDQQITMYIGNLTTGEISVNSSDSRVLTSILIGINPVAFIWLLDIVGEVGGAGLQANQDRAYQDINNELTDLSAQIDLLVQANSKYVDYCDYLVINIPDESMLPFVANLTNVPENVEFLSNLTQVYNAGIANITQTLKNNVNNNSRVFLGDLNGLWNEFYTNPAAYGIAPNHVQTSCFSQGVVCAADTAATYLSIDGLHPVTTVHHRIAEYYNKLVIDAVGY